MRFVLKANLALPLATYPLKQLDLQHQLARPALREAETLIRERLASTVGMGLAPATLRLGTGAAVQVDAVSADRAVLAEIFAHQGPLKGGQRRKIAADALRLITLGRDRPGTRLILALADEQAGEHARGDG